MRHELARIYLEEQKPQCACGSADFIPECGNCGLKWGVRLRQVYFDAGKPAALQDLPHPYAFQVAAKAGSIDPDYTGMLTFRVCSLIDLEQQQLLESLYVIARSKQYKTGAAIGKAFRGLVQAQRQTRKAWTQTVTARLSAEDLADFRTCRKGFQAQGYSQERSAYLAALKYAALVQGAA